MRDRDDTPLDELGRSPRWLAYGRLVELIGCELIDGRLVVGEALGREAARVGNGVNVYAADMLGLDREAVRARATELETRDRALVRELGLDADVSDGLTWDSVAPALVQRIKANHAEEAAADRRRTASLERARLELEPVEVDHSIHVSPSMLASAKSLASAWRVKVIDLGEAGWVARRVDGVVIVEQAPTDALAYYHAALSVRARTSAAAGEAVPA